MERDHLTTSKFPQVLERYSQALSTYESATSPTVEQALALLLARDNIAFALTDKTQDAPSSVLSLLELDVRLKKLATGLAAQTPLSSWRASLRPAPEAWWWFSEPETYPGDHWDWLWSALAAICFVLALSQVADIAPRFLNGGPDSWGALAVIVQSLLTLLPVGGLLSKTGQETFERWLKQSPIPKLYWQETKLALNVLVVVLLFSFRLSLPSIAVLYNDQGLAVYRAGQWANARYNYQRALKLNPDYAEAQYNLGLLYEDLQDFKAAQEAYQLAAANGLDAAYNNLGRLYIRQQNYTAAIPFLLSGLDKAQDDYVRYDVLKNLGWARLGQKRYAEAETHLNAALQINANKAPAHCLLAQIFEGQAKLTVAKTEWENCLRYASERDTDEDAWLALARSFLGGNTP